MARECNKGLGLELVIIYRLTLTGKTEFWKGSLFDFEDDDKVEVEAVVSMTMLWLLTTLRWLRGLAEIISSRCRSSSTRRRC